MGIWLVVGAFCATALGVVLLQGDAQMLALVLTLCPILFAPAVSPRVAAWIVAKPRTMFLGAALLFAVSVVAIAALVLRAPAGDAYIPLAIWPSVLATALAFLPNAARRVQSAQALRDLPPLPASTIKLGVVDELWRDRSALVRVATPWFLVFCLPILAVAVLASMQLKTPEASNLGVLLLCLLIVSPYGAPLVAAVRWARHLAGVPASPWWAIPGRAVFGLFWRLVLFGGVFRVANDVEGWLHAHLAAPAWLQAGVSNGLIFLLLVLLSPLALIFAPVALGAEDKSIASVTRTLRGRRRTFFTGAAWVLAPLCLTWWLSDVTAQSEAETLGPSFVGLALWAVVWFVTVIVASTALTRYYLGTRSDVSAPVPTAP